MRDRRRLAQARRTEALCALQRLVARQALSDALSVEQAEAEEEEAAKADVETVLRLWDDIASGNNLDAHLISGLFACLEDRDATLSKAAVNHAEAREATERNREHLAISDARSAQSERVVHRLKGLVDQRAEEDRLSANDDLSRLRWRAP